MLLTIYHNRNLKTKKKEKIVAKQLINYSFSKHWTDIFIKITYLDASSSGLQLGKENFSGVYKLLTHFLSAINICMEEAFVL